MFYDFGYLIIFELGWLNGISFTELVKCGWGKAVALLPPIGQ